MKSFEGTARHDNLLCCILLFRTASNESPSTIFDLDLTIPSSSEAWSAENADKWRDVQYSGASLLNPPFRRDTFLNLFNENVEYKQTYDDFGGYILISAILYAILTTDRHLPCLKELRHPTNRSELYKP
jgi:hypothetical protein